MKSDNYKPISCDYVDYIEHLATLKQEVVLQYSDDGKLKVKSKDKITTWKNEAGIEYLFTESGLKIRLDHLVSINGLGPGDDCKI